MTADIFWTAILAGLAAGAFNGALARWSLGRALNSRDAVFYAVFAGGIFYRLFFLVGAICLLREKKYIIIPFTSALIVTQLVFEALPLRQHGTKRNS